MRGNFSFPPLQGEGQGGDGVKSVFSGENIKIKNLLQILSVLSMVLAALSCVGCGSGEGGEGEVVVPVIQQH